LKGPGNSILLEKDSTEIKKLNTPRKDTKTKIETLGRKNLNSRPRKKHLSKSLRGKRKRNKNIKQKMTPKTN
jgi:hypothetical protein